MNKIVFTSVVILLSTLTITSHADIYKFTDREGVIHYTNVPQSNDYEKVLSEDKTGSDKDYNYIINKKSMKYKIEPSIIKAVITAESNWDHRAISNKGAMGLMQLMPDTARDMQISNPYDPEQNIEAGTRYLRFLLNKFDGDLNLALAAYNAGPGKVEKSGGIPPFRETKKYVRKVISISEDASKSVKIYKITYNDGTVLYTNTPPDKKDYKLSNF
jgi:soluble lytic murein transglycosylase